MLACGRLQWKRLARSSLYSAGVIYSRNIYHKHVDYYDLLGVKRHASEKEIKFAYFKMAKKFHPDTNKTLDARQMFDMIAEAYEVLSDEKKRQEYDETGLNAERFGGRAEGPGRQSSDATYTAEQMYSKIFGTPEENCYEEQPHEDYAVSFVGEHLSREYVVQLTFEEAALGTSRYLSLKVAGLCDKCDGSRSEMGYGGAVCPYCEGTGEETVRTGHIVARRECSYCHGDRVFIKYKCIECEGLGRKIYRREHRLDIPAGTQHGQVLRFELDPAQLGLTEELAEGKGKTRYLYVTVSVAESSAYSTDGLDLVSNLELSPALALLGGKLTVKGLAKSLDIQVPRGTSSHATLVSSRSGLQSAAQVGDHLFKTVIRVPQKLSWRQQRVLRRYAALEQLEVGTIEGMMGDIDHKFNVNVVEPDKMVNRILDRPRAVQENRLSWSDQVRKRLGMPISTAQRDFRGI